MSEQEIKAFWLAIEAAQKEWDTQAALTEGQRIHAGQSEAYWHQRLVIHLQAILLAAKALPVPPEQSK